MARAKSLTAGRGAMGRLFILAGALWLGAPVFPAETAAPSWYRKESTWRETVQASLEGLIELERQSSPGARFPTVVSEVVRGGEPARHLRVRVADQEELTLLVTGAPDVVHGAATWADARLISRDGEVTRLCHMRSLEVEEGRHSIDVNLYSGFSGPLHIAGRRFEHGIHVYASSKIRVPLGGRYETLDVWIGVDDWVGRNGAVRFTVTGARGGAVHDLWNRVARDFSDGKSRREMGWEREDLVLVEDREPAELARRYADACHRIAPLADRAARLAREVRDTAGLDRVRQLYYESRALAEALDRARDLPVTPLRNAIRDLVETFGDRYPRGGEYLARLSRLEAVVRDALARIESGGLRSLGEVARRVEEFDSLRREALLANPLLDFERLLLQRRRPHGDPRRTHGRGYGVGEYIGLPRQSSKCNPNIEQPFAWENDIAILSPVRPGGQLTTLYRPRGRRLFTDLDLSFDGKRVLFSMPGSHDRWHIFEIGVDGTGLRQITPGDQPEVDYYDGCYLPDGRIVFNSTAVFQGVPCNASVVVGMMYIMENDGSNIRQLCFEQDHDYCPTVLNDGRILYLRWDYTDTPHVWNRMLFTVHPDGTRQSEVYGANSYWPNAIFYARPIPGHPSKLAGIVTGHHVGRVGELVIFDPALSHRESNGVVQRIPGNGEKVEPLIQDKLTEHSWPKFVHPYPLSDKYFLVSAKPRPDSLWGIYLVDVFDNVVLLEEVEEHVLLEPIPLVPRETPRAIPERTPPEVDDAVVYMLDVYDGEGLAGVPRGAVKKLRVFTYHFGYQKLAGINHRVGADGPWEVKRVLGTVPVEEDGSALFRVPAKTPFSVQPLDADGRALQLMRSWATAMPGETVTCVGCHDHRNTAPPNRATLALRRPPSEIEPWYGPTRGFSFQREVQPVLDRYCVGCHDGESRPDSETIPDLRGHQDTYIVFRGGDPRARTRAGYSRKELMGQYRAIFEPSYLALRRRVRVGGLESDLHLLPPMEFHASTSELVQMLEKGHHNVQLDAESWDRLITWIDLNAPCHGTWSEFTPISGNQRERRLALRKLYGGVVEDGEEVPDVKRAGVEPVIPGPLPETGSRLVSVPGWPFDADEARRRQARGRSTTRTVDLGGGVTMEFVWIPAGAFVMGDTNGATDERPRTRVEISRPFWMSRHEVTNEQFARFDPLHDSRFEHRTSWIFSEEYLGWPLNGPRQPVVRVSFDQAVEFTRWMSGKIGQRVTLPSEAQWEYACRAGTATTHHYGDLETDFSAFANLADASMRDLAYEGWRPKPPDIVPRESRFDDGALVTVDVGTYRPNAWGLLDMHGNVAEWTLSTFRPYPYRDGDGRNATGDDGKKVVRGGSWKDRPQRARSAFRLGYEPYQRVHDVGFRVIIDDRTATVRGVDGNRPGGPSTGAPVAASTAPTGAASR